jgi:hypothetical protein
MERARGIEKVHLGWDRMPLAAATEWLQQEFGDDLADVLIALPGARSGRLLSEQLARACGKGLRPPRIVTAGALSDELLEFDERPAGRLARTLAWAEALRGLEARALRDLVARPPEADDLAAWWRLAEEVRGLFGEIAAEGRRFSDIAQDPTLADPDGETTRDGERRRWRALAAAQERMAGQLTAAGLCDPHLARLRAIEERRATKGGHIVLVGVVESNELLRRALAICARPCTALVFAPAELANTFDEWGCLRASSWAERDVSLPLERWTVVDRPGDQAEAVCAELARWNQTYSAEEITIGLGNAEVGPFVKRKLAEHSLRARDVESVTLGATRPLRLLELCGRLARTRRFADFAALVRHPDFELALRGQAPELDPVSTVDEYHNAHLPGLIDGHWLADGSCRRDLALRERMRVLWDVGRGLLGGLWGSPPRRIDQECDVLREVLGGVYGEQPLDSAVEAQRVTLFALEKIGAALSELESLPRSLLPEGDASAGIDLLLRSLPAEYVPPQAAPDDQPIIEMLGWLELPLDNAPALVVVGFEDGQVPKSVRGDAFLPNSLRRSLGLTDDEQRLARDLYATEVLLHSREQVLFVSGRRSLDNDPQVPSRIVFHCPPDRVAARVRRFLGGTSSFVARVESPHEAPELPRGREDFRLEKISVTHFETYLKSPYEYYLKHVARLQTLDDRARELDGRSFGTLAHHVLQRFGANIKQRDSRDAEAIAAFLAGELQDLARELYGATPLPAVRLQVRQLEHRLRVFAEKQAARHAQGWRIHAVEWQPTGGSVDFEVDGEVVQLCGRIDRIDHRPETGQFAVWDYKTGEKLQKPEAAHLKGDGTWRDLQLPLYCWLLPELTGEALPEMGYAALPRKTNEVGFHSVKTWSRRKAKFSSLEEGIESAIEVARDVVRKIRRGEFFISEGFEPNEPILAAIGGLGLLELADDEDEEEAP